jgi:hypothetical protein
MWEDPIAISMGDYKNPLKRVRDTNISGLAMNHHP